MPFRQLTGRGKGTDTATIRERVVRCRESQSRRNSPGRTNSELRGKELNRVASLDEPSKVLVEQAMRELGLSARAYDKIRRVSRTIADLEETDQISVNHVAEAVQYRLLDRRV